MENEERERKEVGDICTFVIYLYKGSGVNKLDGNKAWNLQLKTTFVPDPGRAPNRTNTFKLTLTKTGPDDRIIE